MRILGKMLLVFVLFLLSMNVVYSQELLGVYKTTYNEMTLYKNGNKVTGTYAYKGGRIEGTLSGNVLTGWWYQDNGKGRIRFAFNSDFSAFTGKWGYNDAEPTSSWNGTKINKVVNKTILLGVYKTDYNEMTLYLNGNKITGTYKFKNGRVEGTLAGNVLTGWWYQDNGKGKIRFEFNDDFSAFTGKWSYNDAEPTSSGWNGTKI